MSEEIQDSPIHEQEQEMDYDSEEDSDEDVVKEEEETSNSFGAPSLLSLGSALSLQKGGEDSNEPDLDLDEFEVELE